MEAEVETEVEVEAATVRSWRVHSSHPCCLALLLRRLGHRSIPSPNSPVE